MLKPRSKLARLAQVFSVLGHPALLMPAAVLAAAAQSRSPSQAPVWVAAAVAAVVLAYVVWHTCAGHWQHADASLPKERGQLNRHFGPGLLAAALAAHALGASSSVTAGLAACSGMVLAAWALTPWCKTSLHTAFATFAAASVWPHAEAVLGFGAFALAVAWSRLALARHTPGDVLAGFGVGAAAGVLLQTLLQTLLSV